MNELTDYIIDELENYSNAKKILKKNLIKSLYNKTLTYLKEEFRKGYANPLHLGVYQLDSYVDNYYFEDEILEDLPPEVVSKFIDYLDENEEYIVLGKEFFDNLVYLA